MEYDFIDKYNELVETLSKMIRADKTIISEEDRWLPIIGSDINHVAEAADGHLSVSGSTYTMQTGGSTEYWEFTITKADIELFQIQQLLGAP